MKTEAIEIQIKKVGKHFADFEFQSKKYRLNKWGVSCMQGSGGIWYHAVLEFDSWRQCCDVADAVINATDAKTFWVGNERAYQFKQ